MMSDSPDDQTLFDFSDVNWSYITTKDKCRITMVARSETPMNMRKFWLALRAELWRFEQEYGVTEETSCEQ